MAILSERRRSVAFLEKEGETWACFLVTFPTEGGPWHGYFSFRPGDGDGAEDEVRTTDIFIEPSEAEIHEKARGLGRPLLGGLLASALHTATRQGDAGQHLRRRFRALLARNSQELSGDWDLEREAPPPREEIEHLRSLYASYRLDQVVHLIGLLDPEDFEPVVIKYRDEPTKLVEGNSV